MKMIRDFVVPGVLIALHAVVVLGDGTGLIGYGKTMYDPKCAFACRNILKGCRLSCTPVDSTENHGTAHSPVTTPPECFVKDTAFLRTMAICIDTYCPISDNPPLSVIEDYWASHLGTGTLGDYSFMPVTSYPDALAAARSDERRLKDANDARRKRQARQQQDDHGIPSSPLLIIEAGAPLNVTSVIARDDWQKEYNGMLDFETNEKGHSTYSIVVMLVALFLPVPLSLLRFVPGITRSRQWTFFQAAVINPAAWGKRHRIPVAGGLVPTRGQALYISLISVLNIVLLLAPYVHHHPQSTFESLEAQKLSIIGNRAGSMAMGNVVALFIFAARNNVLLYITDWSYSTYLLLHRWLGYWAVFHTVLHSVMLLGYYKVFGSYEAELIREYWIWGIVGTVAAVALLLSSVLVLRQKVYELFLASHIVLSVLFIVGYYYHIWFCYEYNWGYEIWAFIAAGIWAVERLTRLARMTWQGYRTAVVTSIKDTGGEYLRIDVEGGRLDGGGVAYLCFPTLSWRFWETHPFSIAFSRDNDDDFEGSASTSDLEDAAQRVDLEKSGDLNVQGNDSPVTSPTTQGVSGTRTLSTTTFFARVRAGLTRQVAARVATSGTPTRFRVLLDGPYHHSGDITQLAHCSSVLYIAGGVGITAVLPYLHRRHTHSSRPSWLFWGSRKTGLVSALAPHIAALPRNVAVETTVGQRLDLDAILKRHLLPRPDSPDPDGNGPLGIVVCGPPGMADDVRYRVVQLVRDGSSQRPYVLLDEAFGW